MLFLTVFNITRILNIIDYECINKTQLKNIEKKNQRFIKIISFYVGKTNRYQYKIGYIINTVYGKISYPIQNGNEIRQKYKIKKELLQVFPKIENRKKFKKYLIFIKYSSLPIEIIDKIWLYY